MKFAVWVDFVCPYCYVSICALDQALKKTGKEIEYVHHGYVLAPDLQYEKGRSHYAWMAEHLDMTKEEAEQDMKEGIGKRAAAHGIPFHPDRAIPANTRNAHLLSYYAAQKGRGQEMVTRLARAYYELGENIEDRATLERIAEEVGLESDAVEKALTDPRYGEKLEEDIQNFSIQKIESVPHYVINDTHVSPESKDPEEFVEILEKYE